MSQNMSVVSNDGRKDNVSSAMKNSSDNCIRLRSESDNNESTSAVIPEYLPVSIAGCNL